VALSLQEMQISESKIALINTLQKLQKLTQLLNRAHRC